MKHARSRSRNSVTTPADENAGMNHIPVDDDMDGALNGTVSRNAKITRRQLETRSNQNKSSNKTVKQLLKETRHRDRILVSGGTRMRVLVLKSNHADTAGIDLASGTLVRLRVAWPDGHAPDLATFDIVEATLADDPERDDLAQPEGTSIVGLPRQIGTLRGRKVKKMLEALSIPPDGPLLGFLGPAAPYWEFKGHRPSIALIVPSRGPQLIRRVQDESTWIRFGWARDDVWLPLEDTHASRSLVAARRDRLSGKDLATAIGFKPKYLLATLSEPRDGYCYKICSAILPKG